MAIVPTPTKPRKALSGLDDAITSDAAVFFVFGMYLDELGQRMANATDLRTRHQVIWDAYQHGLEYFDEGAGRILFREADFLVKIAKSPEMVDFERSRPSHPPSLSQKFCDGVRQNRHEAELWGKLGGDNPPLVPVLEHAEDYTWITVPEVTPVDPPYGSISRLKNVLKSYGLEFTDIHSDNVGLQDGRLVVLDYGNGAIPYEGQGQLTMSQVL